MRVADPMRASALFGLIVLGMVSCAVGVTPTPPVPGDKAPPESEDPSLSGTSIVADSGHDSKAVPESNDADALDEGASDAGKKASAKDAASSPSEAGASSCPGYALPNEVADCIACDAGTSGCQANGCYGGYYCNVSLSFHKCAPPPSGC
jgi:hypothetical protein